MKLFNNPEFVKNPGDQGRQDDGTFLHEDQVFETIVKTATPPTIWNQNAQYLKSVTQAITNYSPVSINILDFWHKEELYAVCIPNDPKALKNIDKSKHLPDPNPGFFVNALLGLQEKLAEVYMNNFYKTALKTRNSHTLRTSLMHVFKRYDIDITEMDEKRLLFRNVNALFYEPRFLTNKEYNLKKGKSITFRYATLAAWEAKIEGALTTDAYFCEYTTTGVFQYQVNSVILKDVYDAFVKPLAHPLGMHGYYTKTCKTDLTDKVLGEIIWTADAVTVRCRNLSDTKPVPPPYMMLPYVPNPLYGPDIEVYEQILPSTTWVLVDLERYIRETIDAEQKTKVTFLEPRLENDRIRIIGDPNNAADEYLFTSNVDQYVFEFDMVYLPQFIDEPKWIHELPFPSAIPNKEQIKINENIKDPNHPNNPLPNVVFGTWDGFNLNEMIREMDEGQGNILQSIEHGYGENEYSGYVYNKYIFKNNAYLIEYECQKEDGLFERLIEYYRYDSYDMSIHLNTINDSPGSPLYPIDKVTNIVNGTMEPPVDPTDQYPLGGLNAFGFEDNDPNHVDYDPLKPYTPLTNLGLDKGVWHPLPAGYPTSESSHVTINEFGNTAVLPFNFGPVALQGYEAHMQREETVLLVGEDSYVTDIPPVTGTNSSYGVYLDGRRLFPEISHDDGNGVIIDYPAEYTETMVSGKVKITVTSPLLDPAIAHTLEVLQELPEIVYSYGPPIDPSTGLPDPTKPDRTHQFSKGTFFTATILTQQMVDTRRMPISQDVYNVCLFNDNLMVAGWLYNKDTDSSSIVFRPEVNLQVGDAYVVIWYPNPVKTRHHQAKVNDGVRDDYFPVAMPPLEDYMSKKFYIQVPYVGENVLLFTEGLLRRKVTYDITTAYNEWSVPKTPIHWSINKNVVNTLWRFIPIYTLAARFIQSRGCKVNTFGLKETELPSVREDFLVKLLCYNRNITHYTHDADGLEIATNIIHYIDDDINTPNVIDQRPRTPGIVYSDVERVPTNIQNSERKLIQRP